MHFLASCLQKLSQRLSNVAYLLDNPAYGGVRRSGGSRDLFRLLNKPWFKAQNVRTIIDVGANEGQFLQAALALVPDAAIVACEPLPGAAAKLRKLFAGRNSFHCEQLACGATAGVAAFQASGFGPSSSLLKPTTLHLAEFPGTGVVETIETQIAPLDDVMANYADLPAPYLLKIDVQGYEKQVLLGAQNTLSHCAVVVCELNAAEFYEQQSGIDDIMGELRKNGFELADAGGFIHSQQEERLLYFDAAFVRTRQKGDKCF